MSSRMKKQKKPSQLTQLHCQPLTKASFKVTDFRATLPLAVIFTTPACGFSVISS